MSKLLTKEEIYKKINENIKQLPDFYNRLYVLSYKFEILKKNIEEKSKSTDEILNTIDEILVECNNIEDHTVIVWKLHQQTYEFEETNKNSNGQFCNATGKACYESFSSLKFATQVILNSMEFTCKKHKITPKRFRAQIKYDTIYKKPL